LERGFREPATLSRLDGANGVPPVPAEERNFRPTHDQYLDICITGEISMIEDLKDIEQNLT